MESEPRSVRRFLPHGARSLDYRRKRRVVRATRLLAGLIAAAIIAGGIGLVDVVSFHPTPALAATPPPIVSADPFQSTTFGWPALEATAAHGEDFAGLRGVPEHVNAGARDSERACGEAAAATLIATWDAAQNTPGNPAADVVTLEKRYGGDVEWGLFGTSPKRLQAMLTGQGLNVAWGAGETSMRAWVAAGYPVIVLQDVSLSWHRPGLHWTVVYAYDDDYVYLTNWNGSDGPGRVAWATFREGWSAGFLMHASGVSGMFLAATAMRTGSH